MFRYVIWQNAKNQSFFKTLFINNYWKLVTLDIIVYTLFQYSYKKKTFLKKYHVWWETRSNYCISVKFLPFTYSPNFSTISKIDFKNVELSCYKRYIWGLFKLNLLISPFHTQLFLPHFTPASSDRTLIGQLIIFLAYDWTTTLSLSALL